MVCDFSSLFSKDFFLSETLQPCIPIMPILSHIPAHLFLKQPISPSLVAQSVSDYLWEKKFVSHTPSDFLIKGSYPASVYAVEQGYAPTHYNDIDVFVQVPYAHSDCAELSEIDKKQTFLESDYVQGVIPGSCS